MMSAATVTMSQTRAGGGKMPGLGTDAGGRMHATRRAWASIQPTMLQRRVFGAYLFSSETEDSLVPPAFISSLSLSRS